MPVISRAAVTAGAAALLFTVLPLCAGSGPTIAVTAAAALETAQEEPEGLRVTGAELRAEIPEADAGDDARTRVESRFRLVTDVPVRRVPYRGFELLGTRFADMSVRDGRGRELTLVSDEADAVSGTRRGPVRPGHVLLAEAVGPGDTLELVFRYALDRAIPEDARTFDLLVPVMMADAPPAGSPEDFFTASVTIPADYSVSEAFPTVPKRMRELEGRRIYDFGLQVTPSMVRFRGHVGDPPVLTFARAVDLAVLALLGLLSLAGWHLYRRGRT